MSNKKICQKCGTASTPSSKFCRKCGMAFEDEGPVEQMQKIAQNVSMAAQSARSAASSVESVIRTAGQVQGFAITPPVSWKVVIGDRLPGMDQAAMTQATQTAQKKIETAVETKAGEVLRETVKKTLAQCTVPKPATIPKGGAQICPSCGTVIQPNKKFCGSCGAKITVPVPEPTPITMKPPDSSRMMCPKCEILVAPGKKFCGRCGTPVVPQAKVDLSVPKAPVCPKCGSPVTPGKKFCGNCGGKL